jgi:hypothetical protein
MIRKKYIPVIALLGSFLAETPYSKFTGIKSCLSGNGFIIDLFLDVIILIGLFKIIFYFISKTLELLKIELLSTPADDKIDKLPLAVWINSHKAQKLNIIIAIFLSSFLTRWTHLDYCYSAMTTLSISINEVVIILGMYRLSLLFTYITLAKATKWVPFE